MKAIFSFSLVMLTMAMGAFAQSASIIGIVRGPDGPVSLAQVGLEGTSFGTVTDSDGRFEITGIEAGDYRLVCAFVGLKDYRRGISLQKGELREVKISMAENSKELEAVVVTGTRTQRKITDSPVAVNVLNAQTLSFTQSSTLSEGLSFQPGLRMETDCQTCNYTQLRMNGLQGGYSQILINSRPVFSALTGLYGLEQIPANMIDRVEVVRGGGSALYGSSAVAGTVNVITKRPKMSSYSVSNSLSLINGNVPDNMLNVNASVVNEEGNAGISFFGSRRTRNDFDENGDGYSEMPKLRTNSFGMNAFMELSDRATLGANIYSIYEFRRGGNKINEAPHLADQSEDRTHNIIIGGLDFEYKGDDWDLMAYISGQDTRRKHYTGINNFDQGEAPLEAYGNTKNYTVIGGFQYNRTLSDFLGGKNILSFGGEVKTDYTFDEIKIYDYLIDQRVTQGGVFAQSDWEMTRGLTLLTGVRLDQHNLVDGVIASPRLSLLYKWNDFQFRGAFSTGYRAPQAFDTDLHIAFSGGGVTLPEIDPDLKEERSRSYTLSVNYDRSNENYIYGFTLEGFRTRLIDTFVFEEKGEDANGNTIMHKHNGGNSTVMGATLELRANYQEKIQAEAGLTLQSSLYDDEQEFLAGLPSTDEYMRTPKQYGFWTLTYFPMPETYISLSGVYTGNMIVPHMAGAPGVTEDEYFDSPDFWETHLKISKEFHLDRIGQQIEVFAGIRNVFNAYQDDFDKGKDRDSNYIYGPSAPRTYFFGVRFGILD
ncbi:TonB-dependent receptor (plasmid) [Fulvitalea axinellae]|uniref:TonB-dependent receptor n=1 Tax=Fulvitalea axinellae TaxID=1182444 RepID=A0AAU9CST5_9BACT|nr:TonB-dependent receptor [Fulvitalea axinellae]